MVRMSTKLGHVTCSVGKVLGEVLTWKSDRHFGQETVLFGCNTMPGLCRHCIAIIDSRLRNGQRDRRGSAAQRYMERAFSLPWPRSPHPDHSGACIFSFHEATLEDRILTHHSIHEANMIRFVQSGRLQDALASTQPQATCRYICRPDLLEKLQVEMLKRVLDGGLFRTPEYLASSNVKDVFSRLMASKSLQTNSPNNKHVFKVIVKTYYPDRVKIFFDTFSLHIQDDTHRQRFLKNVHSAMEQSLCWLLFSMGRSPSKEHLRRLQKEFSDLIQAMAIPLHDDTVLATPYDFATMYKSKDEHCALFTTAMRLKLEPEALLLYDAGAVGNKELRLLAEDLDVQKMLNNEEDNSVLAVFLRKVLHKPRSLQSLATMQVSRLLGLCAPGDKEKRARDLGLLDYHVERVLLRHQCGQYREALKQADDEDTAGPSQ